MVPYEFRLYPSLFDSKTTEIDRDLQQMCAEAIHYYHKRFPKSALVSSHREDDFKDDLFFHKLRSGTNIITVHLPETHQLIGFCTFSLFFLNQRDIMGVEWLNVNSYISISDIIVLSNNSEIEKKIYRGMLYFIDEIFDILLQNNKDNEFKNIHDLVLYVECDNHVLIRAAEECEYLEYNKTFVVPYKRRYIENDLGITKHAISKEELQQVYPSDSKELIDKLYDRYAAQNAFFLHTDKTAMTFLVTIPSIPLENASVMIDSYGRIPNDTDKTTPFTIQRKRDAFVAVAEEICEMLHTNRVFMLIPGTEEYTELFSIDNAVMRTFIKHRM